VIFAPVKHERRFFAGGTRQLAPPLCVDLDGTLIKSDSLVDSLLVLMRTNQAESSNCRERCCAAKRIQGVHRTVRLNDIAHLPYNKTVLRFCTSNMRAAGRFILRRAGHAAGYARGRPPGNFNDVLASDAARI